RQVDAPVSGGVVGAENATLAFMVGGSDDDFAAAQPILEAMGKRIVHCGGPGLGQAAKVCNNMILGVSQIVVGEAFVLAERLGLSHDALYEVASNASGQCWALSTNCPVPGPVPTSPANRDYRPGFAGALMAKDLGLALEAIEQTGTDARLGRLAQEIYAAYAAGDGATRDFSGIITDIRAGDV
ncbi:MAG TPA: NAD-binding protein, partial [Microbacterium sp.]|nr:NAD-binding protein [Microbacterium sp.]